VDPAFDKGEHGALTKIEPGPNSWRFKCPQCQRQTASRRHDQPLH